MFPVIQKSLSVLRGMLHICTKHSGLLLCVCLCVREWISTLQKPRQVRSKRCTDQQEWDSVKHLTCRLESQVWTEILCPWLALNLSQGRFSELHPGYRVCTSPGMLCHGNSASLLGWWNCTFCASVLDCAMRGLGEVISKIVCTLRTVEELTSLSSLLVPSSIFPSWCLLRSWCVVPAVVVEDRGPYAEERAGHPKPPSSSLPPSQLLPSSNTIMDKYFRSQ